jgi:hypothetical protein
MNEIISWRADTVVDTERSHSLLQLQRVHSRIGIGIGMVYSIHPSPRNRRSSPRPKLVSSKGSLNSPRKSILPPSILDVNCEM